MKSQVFEVLEFFSAYIMEFKSGLCLKELRIKLQYHSNQWTKKYIGYEWRRFNKIRSPEIEKKTRVT